jgi:hypothetical protein
MVVRIDISSMTGHLRHAPMNEIGLNNRSRKSSRDSNSEISDTDKNHSNDSDIVEEVKVLVLTRDDAERQGTYHCRHCGMEFNDSVKLSIHPRLHYLIA